MAEPTGTRAKVRALLPGESWSDEVSEGANRAYEGPLKPQREEAAKLRRHGRLRAAHKAERASYRIRVRGYDRKYGDKPVAKGYSSTKTALGPFTHSSRKLILRKPTKGEVRTEQIKAVLGGVTSAKLILGAGAGALATDAVKDAQHKSTKAARAAKEKVMPESKTVAKAYTMRITPATASYWVSKSDPSGEMDLLEISKVLGLDALTKIGTKVAGAARGGFAERGWDGAVKGAKSAFRTEGGHQGLRTAANSDLNNLAAGHGTAGKVAGAAAATGLAAGGAMAAKKWLAPKFGQAAAKAAAPYKAKAKKYAMYGAAGAAGTVAAGTALGNTVSPRR